MKRRDALKWAALGSLLAGPWRRTISAAVAGPLVEAGPMKLASDKHLFIDEELVAEKNIVAFTVNPPQGKELVLIADKPWEQNGITCNCNVSWDKEHLPDYKRGLLAKNRRMEKGPRTFFPVGQAGQTSI